MDVALISDTHIPSRASHVPEDFRDRIEAANHVIHAGDFDSEGSLSNVRALAARLTAVGGNMDPRIGLPDRATVELGGVTFVVTHGTGSKRGYEDRVANIVREEAEEQAVGVSGHTHAVMDTTHGGVRLLNPGSATGAAPAERATMMTATVSDGELDVELHSE
ncbi:metallophosphoesterase family protein [Haloarcula salinisoli]|uniref:Phosphoesterase n=1 Tax=Haloarcula salinisoli TaxID=2487746 RepID=A0A8J7YGX6_9EURY|nr:metallophosphoesterase family protein [Halomicroarcula salinisoli]MBX0288167.1 metallophosphatase family protein [Halomicroarcula salinisoli]MBX0305317.1 metallophosphatase family protein [Halomicroarcula salinisoli]